MKKAMPSILRIPRDFQSAVKHIQRVEKKNDPALLIPFLCESQTDLERMKRELPEDTPVIFLRPPACVVGVNRWVRLLADALQHWDVNDCGGDHLRKLQDAVTRWKSCTIPGEVKAIIENTIIPRLDECLSICQTDYVTDEMGRPLMKHFRFDHAARKISFYHPVRRECITRPLPGTEAGRLAGLFIQCLRRHKGRAKGSELKSYLRATTKGPVELTDKKADKAGEKAEKWGGWKRIFDRAGLLEIWDMLITQKGQTYALRVDSGK